MTYTTVVPTQARPAQPGPAPRPTSLTTPAAAWYDRRAAGVVVTVLLGALAAGAFTAGIETPWPWSDEGATYLALLRDWGQLPVLYHGPDAPMVPYYFLAKAWTTAIRAILPGVSVLVAVRLLSAVAATLTVLALYALVARNTGRLAGVLAGLVLIGLPGFDRYAQEARTYALLALAATASWLLLDVWQRSAMRPTLTSSTPAGPPPGSRGRAALTAAYAISLAAVPVIHTFGLFQWPAHAIGALIEARPARSRWRRVLGFAALIVAAAALAIWQVVPSMTFGTGPPGTTALRTVDLLHVGSQLTLAAGATLDLAALAPAFALAALGAALSLRRETRLFAVRLIVWLVVPLALEMYLGAVRTNLFRLRYWIAFLPPLAALAGLGAARLFILATQLIGRHTRSATHSTARGLQTATLLIGAALLTVLPLLTTMPAQQLIRSSGGHGEDLSAVLAGIEHARSQDPAVRVVISNHSASGMLAAADPALIANPLLRLDPTLPTVYTTPVPTITATQQLAGARDLLWIYKGHISARRARRLLPPTLAPLHPSVTSATPAGRGWTLIELTIAPADVQTTSPPDAAHTPGTAR